MRRSISSLSRCAWLLSLTAVFALVVPAAAKASPTLPASANAADPRGDASPGHDARGDITSVSASDNGSQIRLTVTTAAYDDPDTSYNWKAFGFRDKRWSAPTAIYFTLDTNGTAAAYDAYLINDGTGAFAAVVNKANKVVCSAGGGSDPQLSLYRIVVSASCVGNPATLTVHAHNLDETATTESFDTTSTIGPIAPTSQSVRPDGYWMVGATGTVYPFGTVPDQGFYGPLSGVVKIERTPTARGYWVLDSTGHMYSFGDAHFHGNAFLQAGERATTMSTTSTGNGYWIFTNKGRAIRFGDAALYGDMSRVALNGPVINSVSTPTGHGYYMVASDGGVFAFGDAHFYGSMGGKVLNKPVTGLVPTADNHGYWLVASDGGVFSFGTARFRGSMGAVKLNRPVVGMVRFGVGYLMVAADGGIFNFGDRPFFGSLGNTPPNVPVVSVASST